MINNPKDIAEILDMIDNLTFEQLDSAIKAVDEKYSKMSMNSTADYYISKNNINIMDTCAFIVVNSQEITLPSDKNVITKKNHFDSKEGENKWKKEVILAA